MYRDTKSLTQLLRHHFIRPRVFRRLYSVSSAGVAKTVVERCKVLFCSEHFESAFRFTQQELLPIPTIEVVRCNSDTISDAITDATVAIPLGTSLTRNILEQAKKLKLILQYGVGLEGVDAKTADSLGIWVSRIPSSNTPNGLSCAEHAIYLILALLRKQKEMQHSIENRRVGVPLGDTLCGKRILIIGFGGIAQALIPRLKPFQVGLVGVRKRPWSSLLSHERDVADMLSKRVQLEDLADVLPTIDVIILACLQNRDTKGMINTEFLKHCKDGVNIVNVSRGGLLDEAAVVDFLKNGKIGGLGLDVLWSEPFDPCHEIVQHPNVILTPHVAGVTEPSYKTMAKIVAREVQRIADGKKPTRIVNPL